MSTPFRVAATTNSISTSPSVNSPISRGSSISSDSEPGIYTYATVKGHPYGLSYFKLKLFHESGNYPDLEEDVKNLDSYLQMKAKERGLADSQSSYDELVKEILGKIGKSQNEEPLNTFKRVASAVQAIQRLKEAKLPENLDLQNLTSKEIEDISE
jgi:hypothetical protein